MIGEYQVVNPIGKGSFSKVYLVSKSGINYACKVISKFRNNYKIPVDRSVHREVSILQSIQYPGVTRLIDFFQTPQFYCVVIEYAERGTLFDYIIDKEKLSEDEAKVLFKEILLAIQALQYLNISHRDIKPENILIDNKGLIKITDFGLSTFLKSDHRAYESCGSPCYASPECLSGHSYDGFATDLWSAGVVLFAMVTGELPWFSGSYNYILKQIKRGIISIPSNLSRPLQTLLHGLLNANANQRFTVEDALNSSWLHNVPTYLYPISNLPYFSLKKIDAIFSNCSFDIEEKEMKRCSYQLSNSKTLYYVQEKNTQLTNSHKKFHGLNFGKHSGKSIKSKNIKKLFSFRKHFHPLIKDK